MSSSSALETRARAVSALMSGMAAEHFGLHLGERAGIAGESVGNPAHGLGQPQRQPGADEFAHNRHGTSARE